MLDVTYEAFTNLLKTLKTGTDLFIIKNNSAERVKIESVYYDRVLTFTEDNKKKLFLFDYLFNCQCLSINK